MGRNSGTRTKNKPPSPGGSGNYQVPQHVRNMVRERRYEDDELDELEDMLQIDSRRKPVNTTRSSSALGKRTRSKNTSTISGNSRFVTTPRVREFAQIVNIHTFYDDATALLPTTEYVELDSNEIFSLKELNGISNKSVVAYYIDGEVYDGKHPDFKTIQERVGNDSVQLTQAVREFFDGSKKTTKKGKDTSNIDYAKFKSKANQVFLACVFSLFVHIVIALINALV